MSLSSVKRAFKYRFYPSDAQATELVRTFGCVRKVYNRALDARSRAWQRQERVNYVQTSAMLTAWKKTEELAFLSEVSSVPLQQALRHLQDAFVSFWEKRSKHPRFKSQKKSHASAEYTRSAFKWRDGKLTLATGEKIANPRHERKDRARLARAQCDLARKAWGSKSRRKARRKVAKVHARIADRRRDFLHKLSTRLVRENQTLVIEDLTVCAMVKNHKLARAISDASWRELRSMLEYKCAWYGRQLITVDRWFPRTKLCSHCGALVASMPLHVRTWTCGNCGTSHDRDENAAVNLLAAGLAVTVCGDGVRPQRKTPGGQSSTKQKPRRVTAAISFLTERSQGADVNPPRAVLTRGVR